MFSTFCTCYVLLTRRGSEYIHGRSGPKSCEVHWADGRADLGRGRRQELIPRAKLRQRSPDNKGWGVYSGPPEKPSLRPSHSCCGRISRSDPPIPPPPPPPTSQYLPSQHLNQPIYCGRRRDITRHYEEPTCTAPRPIRKDNPELGFCTLRRAQSVSESDMDYYTSSDTSSQDTVRPNNKAMTRGEQVVEVHAQENTNDSTESGFEDSDVKEKSSTKEKPPVNVENNLVKSFEEVIIISTDTEELYAEARKKTGPENHEIEAGSFETPDMPEEAYDETDDLPLPPPPIDAETFYEEEFSYEPKLQKSSTKLVKKSRSLVNLEEEPREGKVIESTRQPSESRGRIKITTGPDGTFMIAGRKASSELNLSDESPDNSKEGTPMAIRNITGEELRKRKEEIFKRRELPKKDASVYFDEINQNNPITTKQKAISDLKKYLHDNKIGLRDLLENNNVVIIEPYRQGEKGERDTSTFNHKHVAEFENSCRITGTTAKSESLSDLTSTGSVSNTLPRASRPHQPVVQRHFFYHPPTKNKELLKEEELPDPDKVRNAREMFKRVMKIRGPEDRFIMLPIAAKICNTANHEKPRITPEVRVVDDKGFTIKPRVDTPEQGSKNDARKTKKWTDTGSLSSGVSSDMSCFDNEMDSQNMDDVNSNKEFSSDEEFEPPPRVDDTGAQPISPEVLKKIRACGTTITYYGGRVISHTDGPVRSPMTMAIMDEIRQCQANRRPLGKDHCLGGKFRLVKSNSCGSRLELVGTEDKREQSRNRFQDELYGKSISQELSECRGRMEPIRDEEAGEDEKQDSRIESQRVTKLQSAFEKKMKKESREKQVPSWQALIETRKQNRAMESRRHCSDMEFEEFEVVE